MESHEMQLTHTDTSVETGSVNWVTFYPSLQIMWVWPGLYHVRRKIYKSQSWSTTTATMHCKIHFVSRAHFLKQWYLLVVNAQEPSFVNMHATIAIYNLLRATPIDLLLLQEFYPCSMLGNIHVQQIYGLHEVTSTHVLVPANLQVATPTNLSRGQQQSQNGVQDFKISRFHLDLRISLEFQDFTEISRSRLDFRISLGSHGISIRFHGISLRFHKISWKFQDLIDLFNKISLQNA